MGRSGGGSYVAAAFAGRAFAAIVWLMGSAIVIACYLTLSYYVEGVKFMLVDYINFMNRVMTMLYNMLVSYNTLRTGAAENLPVYSFAATSLAAVFTITVHFFDSFLCTCYVDILCTQKDFCYCLFLRDNGHGSCICR